MSNIKISRVKEYSSLTLILSYFFIHNIYLVIFGMSLSLYLINVDNINSFIKYIYNNVDKNKILLDIDENKKEIDEEYISKKLSEEDSTLTLVETVEEYGIIPSIDKNIDSKNI